MGWQDAPVVQGKAAWESAPLVEASKPAPGFVDNVKQGVVNLAAGAVRGAGSIGATILAPVDMVGDAMDGKGLSLASNRQRRTDMDEGLQDFGAQPDSLLYKGGKLGGEIAGTAGAGTVLAGGAKALGAAAPVVEALATGGLRAGGATGASGIALRAGAGAATGATSATMVDPHAAGEGALVGAALPVGVKAVGTALRKVGSAVGGAAPAGQIAQSAQKLESARDASKAGYTLPPADISGAGKVMRMLGGLSGKEKTSQVASQRNQQVTNSLVAKALGLPEGTVLSPEVLDAVRKEAGKAYGDVAGLGAIDALGAKLPKDVAVKNVTDMLTLNKRTEVDAGELVRAWKQANNDATGYYRAFARDANPETQAKAKAAAGAAKQIDEFMQAKLQAMGRTDLLDALKAARVRIAKTYNAEAGLNHATGDVSAGKLASQLQKGKPLTGELRQVAEAGGAFPKATQLLREAPGQLSPLDFFAAAQNVLTLPARPIARSVILSKPAQTGMMRDPAPPGPGFEFFSREIPRLAARAAPVLLANP